MANLIAGNILMISSKFYQFDEILVTPAGATISIDLVQNGQKTSIVQNAPMAESSGTFTYEFDSTGRSLGEYVYHVRSTGDIKSVGRGRFLII